MKKKLSKKQKDAIVKRHLEECNLDPFDVIEDCTHYKVNPKIWPGESGPRLLLYLKGENDPNYILTTDFLQDL